MVATFKYLGSHVNETGDMGDDVPIRVRNMNCAFNRIKKGVLRNRDLSLAMKFEIYNTVVVSTGLYGCATWTMQATEMGQMEGVQNKHL